MRRRDAEGAEQTSSCRFATDWIWSERDRVGRARRVPTALCSARSASPRRVVRGRARTEGTGPSCWMHIERGAIDIERCTCRRRFDRSRLHGRDRRAIRAEEDRRVIDCDPRRCTNLALVPERQRGLGMPGRRRSCQTSRMRSLFVLVVVVTACSSPSKPAPEPPAGSGSAEPPAASHASCTADADCVVVETACCDHCNGGNAEAFHVVFADQHEPSNCDGTACTKRGCGDAVAKCEASACTVTIAPLQ